MHSRYAIRKAWTYSKVKKWLIKVLKGIYWSWPQPNIFFMKLYLELKKLSKENEKIDEKHGISYSDVLKTYAASFKKKFFCGFNLPKCIELS